MGDYNIESIYGGGYSSMDADKSGYFTGYRIPAAKLSMATDPRTANILTDVSEKLKSGAKQIEVSTIQPNVFEAIPNQQLKEINRLAKLTGVDVSVHGILVDPSGIGQQGYNELAREESERQMLSNVLRAHEMSPDGNMPITFHSSLGWSGAEYRPVEEGGKTTMEKWRMPVVNQTTGQVTLAEADTLRTPGKSAEELAKGEKISAAAHIAMRNATEWDNSLTTLIAIKERADRAIHETEDYASAIGKKMLDAVDSSMSPEEQRKVFNRQFEKLNPTEKDIYLRYQNAEQELHDIQKHLTNVFDNAYNFGPMASEKKNSYREELVGISEKFGKDLKEDRTLSGQSRAMGVLMNNLMDLDAPEVYAPLEEFAVKKSAETFGNVAFKSYKEFKDKAPIISIENPPAGGGLSRAEDLTNLINAARDKFVENATRPKDKGGMAMSQSDARKQAEKLIGATWDVGHINMIRKYGFSEEDTLKEASKIAPLVKHVHLSDNFGYEHTELPMGMGNVPIEKIMKRLGEKGFEARKVIEAGDWWQHFKTPPFQESLEAFGSPIYGMKMAPYWNQSVGVQGYFSGYGNMLPQINYETMGAGFSMLPPELGGSRQGGSGSRMSGRGME